MSAEVILAVGCRFQKRQLALLNNPVDLLPLANRSVSAALVEDGGRRWWSVCAVLDVDVQFMHAIVLYIVPSLYGPSRTYDKRHLPSMSCHPLFAHAPFFDMFLAPACTLMR